MDNFEKVIDLSSESLSLMKKLKTLKKKYNKRIKIQREKKYEMTSKALDRIQEETKSLTLREDVKEEIDKDDEEFETKNFREMAAENALLHQQIMLLSGQLAPIMDRVGRMYTDFSPHLLDSVNTYNSSISNRERNRQENVDRSRTHHPRRRQNLESDDLSESSDDDFSRRENSESDHEQEQEQERSREGNSSEQQDSAQIRNRLRSISSTISRIRSSISSMRSLIFNNLGGDGDNNLNESTTEEREERKIQVNAQIPIISSPGDIASVHNRLNRFISGLSIDQGSLDRMLDRQAMNGTGTEGLFANLANRNNQAPNSNASGSSSENSRGNNEDNQQQNNEEVQNAENRANQDQEGEPQNNETQENEEDNEPPHHHPGNLFDLLGGPGNDRGDMGFLSSNLAGFGDPSDTIEFHIHAFMPGANAPGQPPVQAPLARPQEGQAPVIGSQMPAAEDGMPPYQPQVDQTSEPERVDASTSAEGPLMVETAVQTEGIRIRRDRRERNRESALTFNTNPFGRS